MRRARAQRLGAAGLTIVSAGAKGCRLLGIQRPSAAPLPPLQTSLRNQLAPGRGQGESEEEEDGPQIVEGVAEEGGEEEEGLAALRGMLPTSFGARSAPTTLCAAAPPAGCSAWSWLLAPSW